MIKSIDTIVRKAAAVAASILFQLASRDRKDAVFGNTWPTRKNDAPCAVGSNPSTLKSKYTSAAFVAETEKGADKIPTIAVRMYFLI